MKKKMLFSLMTIALVGALVSGGIYAYFSDIETSTGNTFTAGTLDLEVDTENPWASTPITVTCFAPGADSTSVDIGAKNVGNLDGDLFMRLTAVTDTGNVITEPECVAENGTWTSPSGPCTGNTPVDNVSTQITLHCSCDGTPVSGIDGVTLDAANDVWSTKIADLAEDGTATITMSGTFSSSAENEYQGDKSTFTIELYLAQDGQPHP